MGCGASTNPSNNGPSAEQLEEEKRKQAAEKIQAVWTQKADTELKAVEDAVQTILQNLGTAVQNRDEAAIRYEIVQIQKLAPPTIALVRAHAGGRCIKVPPAAASGLVQDVSTLLDAGSTVPIGLLMSIESALSIFSWPGRQADKDKVLKAFDEGNWALDLGTESGAQKVFTRVRVQAATGRLIEVLNDAVRWRIDVATIALQELAAVCASGHAKEVNMMAELRANAKAFNAAAFLPSLLCPEDFEMEFGQGIGWEKIVVERQQVLLVAAYHVGGDEAIRTVLSEAVDVIDSLESEKFKQAWLLIWDGLVRSAAQLRPSLFHSEDACKPGEEVRVMGLLECPEFNGQFGVVLGDDAVIQAADDGMECVRVGEALASMPLQNLARGPSEAAGWKLQTKVRAFAAAQEEKLLSWMTEWLNDLNEAAANPGMKQPALAPAMSSQFVSTPGRHACSICGTFVFTIDGSREPTCVVCGANLEFEGDSSASALAMPYWEDDSDGEETGHGKRKGGRARYKIQVEKGDTREEMEEPLEEELQILRLFRLLPNSSDCDRSAFAQSVARRWTLLPEGSGTRRSFAIALNLCSAPAAERDVAIMPAEICAFKAALSSGLEAGDCKEAFECWKNLSPVLLGLAAGVPECQAFNQECRKKLMNTNKDSFADLKEALLAVYDVPELLRGRLLSSEEYTTTLQRCRIAGELPESWDLGNLLDNDNKAPENYFITVNKTEGSMLGIDVVVMETFASVESVGEDGLIHVWNENNPDAQVKKGDSIIDVNGVSGSGKALSAELSQKKVMKITLQRPSADAPNAEKSKNNLAHRNSSSGSVVGRKTLSDGSLVALFQNFVDKTWLNKWTHDRKGDPWGENVPSGFDVKEVVQVMNMKSWQDYLDVRRQIRSELPDNKAPTLLADKDAPMTTEPGANLVANYPVAGGALKKELNEVWLWHGTKPMAADNIVASDFEISRAGNHFGILYGRGIYLAEASIKADEYCRETNEKGLRSMLLCRCILGKYFYTANAETTSEECENSVLKGPFHSVLGDRRKFRKTFREFVFMDHRQVYPCFLVFYTRREAIPRPAPKAAPEKKG